MDKKIYLNLSLLSVSIGLHLLALFLSFQLKDPLELEDVVPAFPMISAVIVDTPAVVFEPPPPAREEPEIIKEINEAVTPDEEAEEEIEEPLEETPPLISSENEPTSNSEPSVQAPETNYIPFYRVEKRPEFIHKASLEYPSQARRMKVEGTVILEADIDSEGKLIQLRIIKAAGFGFEEAAAEMLKESSFTPAVMDGRPVGVRMRFTIKFEI
ncbi:MAG: TonB family protein [Spirochaetales bacterium]|nr:TonB family protein [Spirochaetales bacterium]